MNTRADLLTAGRKRLWSNLQRTALQEVDAVIKALPLPLRSKAKSLPVTFEPVPNKAMVKDGLEPDTLGLFVGDSYSELAMGAEGTPSQILLFLENIWDYAGRDTETYREEVRVTYLHELGHFLGLDEDELAVRDLD
jgi:predicted Zn-dependent protease with MMP-like domain